MIVSHDWLTEYVPLKMPHDELIERLTMSGLNHEGTEQVGGDTAIDLEVTSNRPDCLGHIGVAREIAVLWKQSLTIPSPEPIASGAPAADSIQVRIDCPDLCPRYTARVIRGVKVGPSPEWLQRRLTSLGIAVINNIVDISNYVMFECGQPLHAFDLAKVAGQQIIVRQAQAEEAFLAIDHKTYELAPGMCVVADQQRPVALGGVMGGADSEVSDTTVDLLIEAADFAALPIRNTARKLNLHSPSSHRFERGVDDEGIDWASRRCCQLIVEIAGGTLAEGVVDVVAQPRPAAEPITLRLNQIPRLLGIEVPREEVRTILTDLGLQEQAADDTSITTIAPSWRHDLTREVDLLEEIARIHGYDKIPEDIASPMTASHRRDRDLVVDIIRHSLTAAGYDEALTASVVTDDLSAAFSPWSDAEPLRMQPSMLRGADLARRSIVPSLLAVRRTNESLSNPVIELFETAHVYLSQADQTTFEDSLLALCSGGDYYAVKGMIEAMLTALNPAATLQVNTTTQPLLDRQRSCELRIDGELLGYLGEVTPAGRKQFKLRGATTVAELRIETLHQAAQLTGQHHDLSPYPSISQDLNFIVAEQVRWADLEATVRSAGGESVEQVDYVETYRDLKRDGADRKRLLLAITLRSAEKTLTGDQADAIRQAIVDACVEKHAAELVK